MSTFRVEGISPGIVQADEPWPSRLCSQAVVFRKADELVRNLRKMTGRDGKIRFFTGLV